VLDFAVRVCEETRLVFLNRCSMVAASRREPDRLVPPIKCRRYARTFEAVLDRQSNTSQSEK
jgi:hypothetical protein